MGSEGTPPDSPGRRHRRSSEEGREVEEGSKERHHHHRRRHHGRRHHRRSHGKYGKEKDESLDEEGTVVGAVGCSWMDEREEGEILEDEDGGIASDHLADEITKECAALTVSKIREESVNYHMEDGDIKRGTSFQRNGKSGHGDEGYERASQGEAVSSRSRSPPEVSQYEKEKEREAQSGSRGSRDSELPPKRKRRDEVDCVNSHYDLNGHKARRCSESRDSCGKLSDDKKRSASPVSYRENFIVRGHSPSYSKYCDEVKSRGRSSSGPHLRERSYDLDRRTSRANSSDSRDNIRSDSDRERDAMYDKRDRHEMRSRAVDFEKNKLSRRERERSISSCGRHDRREDRHGSQDRNRERERDRSRDWERNRGRDRERERDRCRDKDRDCIKAREINRESERVRMRTKEMVGDLERFRDSNNRDSDRVRDREMHRDRDRELNRQKERDRVRDHDRRGESRQSRYDESEIYRNKRRSNESVKQSSSAKHIHEDGKEKKPTREDEEDYQEKIDQQLAKQEEEDPEKIIEESRRRRQAILEKYKKQQSQHHSGPPADNQGRESASVAADTNTTVDAPQLVAPIGSNSAHDSSDVSAADMKFSIGKSPQQNGMIPEKIAAGGLGYGTPKSERSADMFCDDIFGESPAGIRKMGKEAHLAVERSAAHDNWDDAEGYYSYRLGEVLDGRYEIVAAHGKGVYSTVVRAKDLKAGKSEPEEVAIKIIRNNDTMYKAGLEELVILKKLAGADPEDKRHCVRFISSFKYRNHLCLVFESLHMNLREVLKKFGRNIGLKLTAVRAYAKQLFIALKHLRNCGVLHCDIKPDNMLVNEAKNVLKLCDFGNAMFAGKNEITPYLVSRFYRSPEIILGLPYDHPMDMWSVGCCLFELYNGKVLFPGPSNNEMLRLHMELKGPFPKKMLRKGAFMDQHFDHDLNFHATEEDPVTKKPVKRLLHNIKPKDMGTILTSFPEEDPKMLGHFKDLLERMFVLDPEKRLTVSQALSHPFITGK